MPNRVEELASMRAPNQSGVDASAVIKALSGNPDIVATPTTYAYGMKVSDAQKEAQLGAQNQARRESALQDARNAAMEQDRQQFDMAMKAHSQYMAERNLALSERVANAEIALKNARMRGIPDEIKRVQLDNEKLMLDIEREKEMDALTFDIPTPGDPTKTTKVPARVLLSSGGRNVLNLLTGRTGNETGTERTIKNKAQIYTSKGINPEDAYLLAASKPETSFGQISKRLQDSEKARAPKYPGYQADYGTKKDASGKDVPMTRRDFQMSEYSRLVDEFFPMLSEETRAKLKEWGPGALSQLDSPNATGEGGLSQESIDAITRALIDQYQ